MKPTTPFSSTVFVQFVVVAAVVATLTCLPVGVAAALVLHAFGVPFGALLTFGGRFHAAIGLVLWWLLIYVGACGYAAWGFPWSEKAVAPPPR